MSSKSFKMKRLLIILLFCPFFLIAQEDYTNKKTALVIGNSAYPNAPLRNPRNDAVAMTATLEELGFEVLSYIDISRAEMRKAINEFGIKLTEKDGVGLFYYAGHGLQYQGKNYFVPIDAQIQQSYEIEDECVKADLVLRMMEQFKNPLNIVIIDACRNNPYTRSFRDMNQGLAKPDNAPVGSIVAFATAPGSIASDGGGENGLYTQELLKAMKTPGYSLEQVFKEVRNNVLFATNDTQIPWENSSLRGDFFFIPQDASKVIITSASISTLYLNCGNPLNVQVPELGLAYNPEFSVIGAEMLIEDQKGFIILIPNANQVELTVSQAGKIIETTRFAVREPPKPTVALSSQGKPINLIVGVKAPGPSSFDLKVVPEETFAALFPKDARYRVVEWEIILARGNRPLLRQYIKGDSIRTSNATLDYKSKLESMQSVPLNAFIDLAKPGDRYVIEIKKVERANYQNKIEDVTGIPTTVFTIPLH